MGYGFRLRCQARAKQAMADFPDISEDAVAVAWLDTLRSQTNIRAFGFTARGARVPAIKAAVIVM